MKSARRRLLIRPGAIGDCIVSLPALEYARGEYTEVWAAGQNVPLIRFADRVRSIASTGLDMLEFGQRLPELAAFDSIYSWYGSTRPQFRQAVSNLPCEFFQALPAQGQSDIHAVDWYMRQVGGPDGAVPVIDVGPVQKRRFVAIHPFSGSARKNWPLRYYEELARRLTIPCEFCVGPEQELDGALRFEDLWDVARWLAGAVLYIGNDSGITHLAAAVGVPVVASFCTTDPRVWAPRGHAEVSVLVEPDVNSMIAETHRLVSKP